MDDPLTIPLGHKSFGHSDHRIAVGLSQPGVREEGRDLRHDPGVDGLLQYAEKNSGLVMKLQTLDVDGRVLEQAAFSELQMDAPVSVAKLTQMMENTDGYRVERPEMAVTTAAAEGWAIKHPVAGFKAMSCLKRPTPGVASGVSDGAMQWVFSDGLASVSVFVEAFDARKHTVEGSMALGATQTLTRRLSDKSGDWWLTVIGEVPRKTLAAFAQGLERTR